MKARKTAPTQALGHRNLPQSFRVWVNQPVYLEDPLPWKCTAAFQFLTECLDYIGYCQDSGGDVIFQSPADCRLIKATDRRVVYLPKAETALLS